MSPTKYERRYKCSVTKEDVTIHGVKKTLYGGPGPFPVALALTMTGCSGVHKCKLFAVPSAFQSPEPTGCPYHDNLNKA